MSLACVGSTRSAPATLGRPPYTVCVLSLTTLLRLQAALQGAGPELHALSRSKRLRFSGTPQGRRLSWACVSCPFPVGATQATRSLVGTLSPGAVCFTTSPVPAAWFPRARPSPMCPVSLLVSRSLAVTLLADVNRPESQEVLVRNWKPALSLVGDAVSGAKFAPF